MERDYSGELLRFIQEHPSVYHVIEGQRRILLEADTNSCWRVSTGRSGREESISSPETTRAHRISGPQKAFPRFYVDGQPQRFPRSEGQ